MGSIKPVDLTEVVFTDIGNEAELLAEVESRPMSPNDMDIILILARSGIRFTPAQFSRIFCRGRQIGRTQEIMLSLIVEFFRRMNWTARFRCLPKDPSQPGVFGTGKIIEEDRILYDLFDHSPDDAHSRRSMFLRFKDLLRKLESTGYLEIEDEQRYQIDVRKLT